MSLVETEHVLVVPAELLHRLGYFQGFQPDSDNYLEHLLDPEHTSYRPRLEMEEDPSFKQLIPYVLFRHTNAAGEASLFQYTRGKGQGEKRLRSKKSVGVGGHISSDDAAFECPYQEGMRRELEEEVRIESDILADNRVGLINDDETEVGRVHLGVVHLIDLKEPSVAPREADLLDAEFTPVEELLTDLAGFETWSQICLKALFADSTCVDELF